ncbi:hypothetical protein BC940DRAFT_311941 [Gongronella butleri]|nr:hypothetical protein BC940DRAFT_311941 [Gongronella butleri]
MEMNLFEVNDFMRAADAPELTKIKDLVLEKFITALKDSQNPLLHMYIDNCHNRGQQGEPHNDTKKAGFKCDYEQCGKILSRRMDLERHKATKHNIIGKNYECGEKYCDKHFTNKAAYDTHLHYVHSDKRGRKKCTAADDCTSYFNSAHDLRLHIAQWHMKLIPCENRGCFVASETLEDHMRHLDPHEKNKFPKISLYEKIQYNDETKEYMCPHDSCSTTVKDKGNIYPHYKRHHCPYYYMCKKCKKLFNKMADLDQHLLQDHPN